MASGDTAMNNEANTERRSPSGSNLSFRADYYGGDFVEDGSFLVLSTEGLSLSPGTPSGEDKDMEVVDEVDEEMETSNKETEQQSQPEEGEGAAFKTPTTSMSKSQVLGEDVESSVESSHSSVKSKQEEQEAEGSMAGNSRYISMTGMSMNSNSSVSTDAHLIETGEEVNFLVAENKKLTELLADSNEKMKECISTTERLKADHEENKKKHETSREIINQLRQDNEMLRSQVTMIQSQMQESRQMNASSHQENTSRRESLERQSHTISELNERLKTVLNVNGQLNDQLLASQKANDNLRAEITVLQTENEENRKTFDVMKAEIDTGRQAIAKFKEHQTRIQNELETARSVIQNLESVVEEKSNLVESLRRNMEDTVTSLERCNYKLNQKEQELSLLTTKVAAINAESEVFERLQFLEMQCHTYRSDFEKVREEKAKLVAEKDALMLELNAANQQLKVATDTLDNYRRQSGEQFEPEFLSRNENSAATTANANEPLPSPLTSLPTVAGQLVGFVRRELLGWEDQAGAAGETNPNNTEGSAAAGGDAAVVQQPKQETIPPCPICRKKFPSLERLTTHASSCGIEVDEIPSDPFVFP